jgi:hypothetical protein
MIWLTWRQYRLTLLMGVLVLIALAYVFVQDANALNAAMQQHHYGHCFDPAYLPCGLMIVPGATWQWRTLAGLLLPWLPLITGVFIGAPLLAREYEQRTHAFVWTQSMSRLHWLSVRLLAIVGATLIGFGVLSLVTTWWGFIQDGIASSPWDTFLIRGSVPIADALFCLMCGVMVGAFIRRTLPAMALTFLLLLLAQGGLLLVYPRLLPPSSQLDYYNVIRQQNLMGKFGDNSQDLILAVKYAGPDGKVVENVNCGILGPYIEDNGTPREVKSVTQCYADHHVKPLVEYQRFNERFWPLQLVTTIVLLLLTALLTAITCWQLQRRIL